MKCGEFSIRTLKTWIGLYFEALHGKNKVIHQFDQLFGCVTYLFL